MSSANKDNQLFRDNASELVKPAALGIEHAEDETLPSANSPSEEAMSTSTSPSSLPETTQTNSQQQSLVTAININDPQDTHVKPRKRKPSVIFHLPPEDKSMTCDSTTFDGSQFTLPNSLPVGRDLSRSNTPDTEHNPISSSDNINDEHVSNNDRNPAVAAAECDSSTADVIRCMRLPVGHRTRKVPVPDDKKDDFYWSRRLKNNDSARRSRKKRKSLVSVMNVRLHELVLEYIELTHELAAVLGRIDLDEMCQPDASSFKDTTNTPRLASPLSETVRPYSAQVSPVSDDDLPPVRPLAVDTENITPSLKHGFGTDTSDHIENNACGTNIRCSTAARTETGNGDSEMPEAAALDLTMKCHRSTPARGSRPSSGASISCRLRYHSPDTSDSSGQEDNTSQEDNNSDAPADKPPMKSRWKKIKHEP